MNVKSGRTYILLLALLVAPSVNARAADDSQWQPPQRPTTADDKALEARRLAAQAAALANRAAALANESQAQRDEDFDASYQPAPPANIPQRPAPPRPTNRLATEAYDRAAAPAAQANYSRGRQQSYDAPIRFSGQRAPVDTVDEASAADDIGGPLLNSYDVRMASRSGADRGVRAASDQEPIPSPNSNNRGPNGGPNNGPDAGNVMYEGCNGGGNSGCDTGCCDTACCNSPCLFWVGGVEATFLKPNFKHDGADVDITNSASGSEYFSSTDNNGLDSLYVAPRIWLGVESCCWGADIKYWQMRAWDNGYDPSLNNLGQWAGADCGCPDVGKFSWNGLNLYTIDLEMSRRFCLRDDWMAFSMGVRHAEIRHDASITVNSDYGDTNLIAYGREDSFSQGTGLVFGWYGRRAIYPCSCVNWYYNLHYSVLWGPTNTAAETAAQIIVNDPGSAGSTNNARTHVDDTLLIGEAQLGLEWDYALRCLPANAFFRVGIEFQSWDGGHGSSQATSFAGTTTSSNNVVTDTTQVTANAKANGPELDLFGFTIGTGLTW